MAKICKEYEGVGGGGVALDIGTMGLGWCRFVVNSCPGLPKVLLWPPRKNIRPIDQLNLCMKFLATVPKMMYKIQRR